MDVTGQAFAQPAPGAVPTLVAAAPLRPKNARHRPGDRLGGWTLQESLGASQWRLRCECGRETTRHVGELRARLRRGLPTVCWDCYVERMRAEAQARGFRCKVCTTTEPKRFGDTRGGARPRSRTMCMRCDKARHRGADPTPTPILHQGVRFSELGKPRQPSEPRPRRVLAALVAKQRRVLAIMDGFCAEGCGEKAAPGSVYASRACRNRAADRARRARTGARRDVRASREGADP